MTESRKHQITALLKSIETGEPGPIAIVNQAKYIQHNPQTHAGSEGLETLFARLSKTNPRVNAVRAFEDAEYVFAHMEYDFSAPKVCFEVFRFEDGLAVEHWDNIQTRKGPNRSGHDMVGGPTKAVDHDLTEINRRIARSFIEDVLISGRIEKIGDYVDVGNFTEHNPQTGDDLAELRRGLDAGGIDGRLTDYQHLHRVLADGSFVLTVSEGTQNAIHCAYYDLFRIENGLLAEHWDTTEKIAPRIEWKNKNGKF